MKVNQLKAGAFLSYAQMALGLLIGLLYTPLMIRALGQSEYGLYNTVRATISSLSILSLGFNISYIRYYSRYKHKERQEEIYKLNGLFLLVFLVIGIIALFCGLFLTFNLTYVFDKGLTPQEYEIAKVLMLLLTISLSWSFPASVFTSIISAHEKFLFLKILSIGKTVVSPLIHIPILLLGYGSIGLVVSTVAVTLIIDLVYIYYVIKKIKQKFVFKNFEKGILKDLFIFSSFIAFNIIVDQINNNMDKFLLGRYLGTGAVAIYSLGYTLYTYYISFSTSISSVLTPKIHSMENKQYEDETEKNRTLTNFFVKVGRLQFLVIGLILVGFFFFGEYFINIWAGPGYEESYVITVILMVIYVPSLIQNVGIEIRRAKNKHKVPAIFMLVTALGNLILSIFLIQKYEVLGAVLGTAFAVFANTVAINLYYYYACGINVGKFWMEIGKLLPVFFLPIATGLLIGIFWKISSVWIFLIQIAIFSVVYVTAVYFFGLNKGEKERLGSFVKRICKKREKG